MKHRIPALLRSRWLMGLVVLAALPLPTQWGRFSPVHSERATLVQDEPREVVGLFSEPSPRAADAVRALASPPSSELAPPPVGATIVYDTQTGTAVELGPGDAGRFSPDGRWMAWTAFGLENPANREGWLLDLATMERRSLGPASVIFGFPDNDHVWLAPRVGDAELVDINSGARRPAGPNPLNTGDVITYAGLDGLLLRGVSTSSDPFEFATADWQLRDPVTGRVVLRFSASTARSAGPGELLVTTPPRDGMTNIFIVDIATGAATFIASASIHQGLCSGPGCSRPNWPLSATRDYVLWTASYCGANAGTDGSVPADAGRVRLLDRRTGALTELDTAALAGDHVIGPTWLELLPGGLITAGETGGQLTLDPESLAYRTVLQRATGYTWSPDGRYASHGFGSARGGLCG